MKATLNLKHLSSLAVVVAMAVTACNPQNSASTPKPGKKLDFPIAGVWTAPFAQSGVLWDISCDTNKGTGTLIVEVKGKKVAELPFDVSATNRIEIRGGTIPLPHLITGETVDYEALGKKVHLTPPPQGIIFKPYARETTNGTAVGGLYVCDFLKFESEREATPILFTALEAGERMLLPFGDIVATQELKFGGVIGTVGADMNPASGSFTEFVHPEGRVTALSIQGRKVEIADPNLKNGILTTKEFGGVELVMAGLSEHQRAFLATREQIQAIAKWLEAPDKK